MDLLSEVLRRLQLDLTTYIERQRVLISEPQYVEVSGLIASGFASTTITHGLGRVYSGAIITGVHDGQSPQAELVTETAVDASKQIVFKLPAASVADCRFKARVF